MSQRILNYNENESANQWGGSGPLSAGSLLEKYLGGSGSSNNLNQGTFNTFLDTMQPTGRLDKNKTKGFPAANFTAL